MKENGEENVYTKYTAEAVKAGLWWAKAHSQTIALRGEVCCLSVQKSSYNQDCQRNDFFMYGVNFPQNTPGMNWLERHGCYGTKYHFTKIAQELAAAGYNVKTVPVLGEEVVTRELLKKYNDQPWSAGEGVVLNIDTAGAAVDEFGNPDNMVWHYKSKSREYLMKLRNINGCSEGDRACCGPYGNIRCAIAAKNSPDGIRKFKVEGAWKIYNGIWTMRRLRAAITKVEA